MPKSLRDIAVGKADSRNLKTGPQNYCPQCGEPTNTGLPHSHYIEQELTAPPGGGKRFDPKAIK